MSKGNGVLTAVNQHGSGDKGGKGDGDEYYVPPLPHFPDLKAAKVAKEQASRPPGINHYHTGFLLLIQIGLCIIWGLTVQQDKFPKQPIPRAGLLENPDRIDQVPSFKRYPPGYDIFTGSERINQYKVQEVKKEVRMHLFALRTVESSSYTTRTSASSHPQRTKARPRSPDTSNCDALPIFSQIHCSYLQGMLAQPDFDLSKVPNSMKDYTYECQWT
eukprot:133072-Rhodomonas_salina.2